MVKTFLLLQSAVDIVEDHNVCFNLWFDSIFGNIREKTEDQLISPGH